MEDENVDTHSRLSCSGPFLNIAPFLHDEHASWPCFERTCISCSNNYPNPNPQPTICYF